MEPENRDEDNGDTAQPRPPRSVQDMLRYAIEAGQGTQSVPEPEQVAALDPEVEAEEQVLIFLWFAGHEVSSYNDVADRFDVAKSELLKILRRLTMFISRLGPEFIRWPSDEQMRAAELAFRAKGMPGAIGAIDGSHVVIDRPKNDPASYTNRKNSYSLQRRRFLEEAFSSLTHDIVNDLREAIQTLKTLDSNTLPPETYEHALDVIAEHVDNLDAANDFVKLEGFTVLDKCLKSSHPGIRWRMADIVAQCAQNNPFCQYVILSLKVLELLIHISNEDPDERCKTKAFFAISNIVRDSPAGMKEFMRLNGFSAVRKAMKSENKRLSNKAAFFFSSVVSNQPNFIWDVVSMGFTEVLISLLKGELDPSLEFVAASLLVLAQQSNEAIATCKKKELGLDAILKRIVNENSSNESYTELVGSCKELTKLLQ